MNYYDSKIELLNNEKTSSVSPILVCHHDTLYKSVKNFVRKLFGKKVKKQNNTETIYTSFSGSDTIVYLDDKPIAELQGIKWINPSEGPMDVLYNAGYASGVYIDEALAMEYPIVIKATIAIFHPETTYSFADSSIVIKLSNEQGMTMSRKINGVIMLQEICGISVDTIALQKDLYLAAKSMTDWE